MSAPVLMWLPAPGDSFRPLDFGVALQLTEDESDRLREFVITTIATLPDEERRAIAEAGHDALRDAYEAWFTETVKRVRARLAAAPKACPACAHHDTPACPACGQQCVVGIAQIAWWRAQNPEHRLWCSRCGHAYVGTDAEVAQAAAADAAFDRLDNPALAAAKVT